MKRRIKGNCLLFTLGGVVYGLLEIIWRKRTHWSMVLTGGFCFVALYKAFKLLSRIKEKHKRLTDCIVGAVVITVSELISGYIFNIWLGLKVWSYKKMPFNFKGQICLFYSILWGVLCLPASVLCRAIDRKYDL